MILNVDFIGFCPTTFFRRTTSYKLYKLLSKISRECIYSYNVKPDLSKFLGITREKRMQPRNANIDLTGKAGAKRTLPGNPLAMAVANRDRQPLEMVHAAVRHKSVMPAYQPLVQAKSSKEIAFFEALIRVLDETQRVIPAR